MLVKATYDFVPRPEDTPNSLRLVQDEILFAITSYHKDPSWLKVANERGKIGYVPLSHVDIIPPSEIIEREPSFLSKALSSARMSHLVSVPELEYLKEVIIKDDREFYNHSRALSQLFKQVKQSDDPPRPRRQNSSINSSSYSHVPAGRRTLSGSLKSAETLRSSSHRLAPEEEEDDRFHHALEKTASSLVKIVQESTNDSLSPEAVVHNFLRHIKKMLNPNVPEKINSLLVIFEGNSRSSQQSLKERPETPSEILHFLTNNKRKTGKGYLLRLLRKLSEALSQMSVRDLDSLAINSKSLSGLVKTYDDEDEDEEIKSTVLDIFSIIATTDPKLGSLLASSTNLPLILAKELVKEKGDTPRLAGVLTTLLNSSRGESRLASELGPKFPSFLFKVLDNDSLHERVKSSLMSLLLALNLQFSLPEEENLVITNLAGRGPCQPFISSLIRAFEEGDTSTSILSVIQMLKDIFSSRATSSHFQKTDLKWMIDTLVQRISETKGTSSPVTRTHYLQLLWMMIRTCGLTHRLKDVRDLLLSIFLEEDAVTDHKIVRAMGKEFPQVFSRENRMVTSSTISLNRGHTPSSRAF